MYKKLDMTPSPPGSGPEVALYGKDDVPSNLEIVSLVLLGSFLTVSLFLSASTFYYRRKVRALLSKHTTTATTSSSNCNNLEQSHNYHNNNAAVSCDGLDVGAMWPIGKAAKKSTTASAILERPPAPSLRGHYRASSADILIMDDTVVDRYDLHGVKIETDYSDCETMIPNGTGR
jgi:hypothetical protein